MSARNSNQAYCIMEKASSSGTVYTASYIASYIYKKRFFSFSIPYLTGVLDNQIASSLTSFLAATSNFSSLPRETSTIVRFRIVVVVTTSPTLRVENDIESAEKGIGLSPKDTLFLCELEFVGEEEEFGGAAGEPMTMPSRSP